MGLITDIIKELPLTAVQQDKIIQLEKRISELEQENNEYKRIVTGCPRCRSLNWSLAECSDHPMMPGMGITLATYRCPDCGIEQKKNLS